MSKITAYLFGLCLVLYGILIEKSIIISKKLGDLDGTEYIWFGIIGIVFIAIADFYKQNYAEPEKEREEKIVYEKYICNLVASLGTALFMLCFFSVLNISELTNDILLFVGLTSMIICGNRIYKKVKL